MLLKDWLKKEGIRPYVFAKNIGMGAPNMYRCLSQAQRVSAKYALKIEAVTKGQVTRSEALFPEDYVETDESGGVQIRNTPKIHYDLAKGVELKRNYDERPIVEEEFYKWAYDQTSAPSPLGCCICWAEFHPGLKRIDHMPSADGRRYMEEEYRKSQKKRNKEKTVG